MTEERRVHPDCINASNPYHECVEYCFRRIAEGKDRIRKEESDAPEQEEDPHVERLNTVEHAEADNDYPAEENVEVDYTKLTGRQKKLFELRLKMNEARKANQTAMVAEKKRMEAPPESRGISNQKWLEERKKKLANC
ncbi:hypothetical protein NE237_001497 [Protea cynaroides]|uniref:Uncharacterized protein n=1 Tax=Protea cynaroides TaxID=273540 RepID=A0A9Q0KTG1_9MAGN|nr:hypothetical protein NE237_001497 [Protea cynaroides]